MMSNLGSSTCATPEMFSSYSHHKSLKSAFSKTALLPLTETVKQSLIATSVIYAPLHSKFAKTSFTMPPSSGLASYVEVLRMVMQHLRSQFLHLAEKLAVACCFSISTSSSNEIPTSFAKDWLQLVHLILANQIASLGTVMVQTFYVRALRSRLKTGIKIYHLESKLSTQQASWGSSFFCQHLILNQMPSNHSKMALFSSCLTTRMSPTRNLRLFSQLIITHPAEQPGAGGQESSPLVQHWHPWIKKSFLPHISSGICGSRIKLQGVSRVQCILFLQAVSLQVEAGMGPTKGVHCSSGFKQPLSWPEYPWVSMRNSPLPPTNLPVRWQQVKLMGRRSLRVRQQSSSQRD